MEKKLEQRKFAKEILSKMGSETQFEKSQKIANNLSDFLTHLKNTKFRSLKKLGIGAFCPIQNEVVWYLNMKNSAYEFCFPKTNKDKTMSFYSVTLPDFKDMNWGASIPEALMVEEKENLDITLTPGLLFAKNGERLGRGAGFYDRYLQNYSGITIGLAFEEQIVAEIATDKHDIKLDYIITDKCIYMCKGVNS
ncbi:MAG: 5-formyltetrahydrofolate cyclo-ligase [Bacteriovoracaceae bacterium]|nr:5-formyltetrahydrofolate cyclo-ligase [Bacteriovoracaceae bacterium]